MIGNFNGYGNGYGYQQQNGYQQYTNASAYQQQTPQAQVMNPALASINQGNVQDERIWISSAAAAEAFPVHANCFVRLWHNTQPIYYEKSADAMGRPSPMIAYEYKVLGKDAEQKPQVANVPDYESEIKSLKERIEALEKASTNTSTGGSNKKGGEKT